MATRLSSNIAPQVYVFFVSYIHVSDGAESLAALPGHFAVWRQLMFCGLVSSKWCGPASATRPFDGNSEPVSGSPRTLCLNYFNNQYHINLSRQSHMKSFSLGTDASLIAHLHKPLLPTCFIGVVQ